MGERIKKNTKKPLSTKENSASNKQKTDFRSQSSHVNQILFFQKTIGNQAMQRLIKSGALQAKLRIGQPGDVYEQEADRVADAVMRMPEMQRQVDEKNGNGNPILIKSTNNKVQRDNGEERDETEHVSTEEFDLTQQMTEHRQLINRMESRYLSNLRRNALNARLANERFIEFYESGINQLRSTGTVSAGVGYLFGTPGAVVALCIIVLTEVAAQGLSNRSAKIAAAATGIQTRLDRAIAEKDERFQNLRNQINSTSSRDWAEWAPIWSTIANIGIPEIVPENILYRDLLIELARGGGYNISGSQWNVENMSIFGRAPWYHSWDWGSPGWVNGRDIADELNALAEGDPSTRRRVSLNPP
ncbi:MAG: hypothetical protein MIO93_05865 [ANME-2 cluster archaeon]|nr:hypothetical protein [ANME-2 cluster archaeon]